MKRKGWTTIAISKELAQMLQSLGKKGERYEDILRKILKETGKNLGNSKNDVNNTNITFKGDTSINS